MVTSINRKYRTYLLWSIDNCVRLRYSLTSTQDQIAGSGLELIAVELSSSRVLAFNWITGLRAFALIVTAHPTMHEILSHVMHRVRALSSKVNNNRANGNCYSFA